MPKKQNEKIYVQNDIDIDLDDIFDGNYLSVVIDKLEEVKEILEDQGWKNIEMYCDDGFEYREYQLRGSRIETDDEFTRRIDREKKLAEKRANRKLEREKKERKIYEKLKQKFE